MRNIRTITLTILLVLISMTVGCGHAETASSKGLKLIEKGKYEEASTLLQNENINLYNYCQARLNYNNGDYLVGYWYLEDIKDTYEGPLREEIINYKADMNAKNVQFGFRELENGNFDKAVNWFHELAKCDKSCGTLENYSLSLKYFNENNYLMAKYYANYGEGLDSYSGYGEEQIKNYNNKFIKGMTSEVIYDNQEQLRAKAKSVQIGMTQEQVKESSWGNPLRINRTTTANGISEQWVYSGFKFLYFDNGILTAIQN